jgi:hypothetical protein
MITANEYRNKLTPAMMSEAVIEERLGTAADAAMIKRQTSFVVNIPRHSMDLAKKIAVAAGWSVEVMTVRSMEADAPDGLRCSLP